MFFMAIHQYWCIFSKSNSLKGQTVFGHVSLGLWLLFSQIDAGLLKTKYHSRPAKHKMGVNYRRESLDWDKINFTTQS